MKKTFQSFLTALSFLSILPVQTGKASAAKLASSMIFFPVVGFLIASVSLCLVHFLEPFFYHRIAALLLVLFPILLSGGLHLDGFADFCDGLQGKTRTDMLRIMKDSRTGVWGAGSVFFLILLKWELILMLSSRAEIYLLALTVSRASQVFLSFALPYAGYEKGLGKSVAQKVKKRELMGAGLFTVLTGFFLLGFVGIELMALTTLFIFLLGLFYKKKLGGVTGDLLGASSELTELVIFLFAVFFFS